MSKSAEAAAHLPAEPQKPSASNGSDVPLAPEDFYYEGAYMVFTEAYHLKRGYCCNSGCRHCPFDKA